MVVDALESKGGGFTIRFIFLKDVPVVTADAALTGEAMLTAGAWPWKKHLAVEPYSLNADVLAEPTSAGDYKKNAVNLLNGLTQPAKPAMSQTVTSGPKNGFHREAAIE